LVLPQCPPPLRKILETKLERAVTFPSQWDSEPFLC
jgi:hypothetical protein